MKRPSDVSHPGRRRASRRIGGLVLLCERLRVGTPSKRAIPSLTHVPVRPARPGWEKARDGFVEPAPGVPSRRVIMKLATTTDGAPDAPSSARAPRSGSSAAGGPPRNNSLLSLAYRGGDPLATHEVLNHGRFALARTASSTGRVRDPRREACREAAVAGRRSCVGPLAPNSTSSSTRRQCLLGIRGDKCLDGHRRPAWPRSARRRCPISASSRRARPLY